MGVRISNLYALFFIVGLSILIGLTVLSDKQLDNDIAEVDVTNLGDQMLKEERRGYDIEIRSLESSERSTVTVFSGEFPSDGQEEAENNEEVLLIDGKVIPYSKTSEGYRIYYQPPTPDLPSAARSYVDTQPKK